MITYILNISEKIFDKAQHVFENSTTNKIISFFLVFIFLIFLGISFLDDLGIPFFAELNPKFANSFFAIKAVFTILLLIELFSLIFVLPSSVSQSVAKQLELLSLIFIRGAFKEFSHINDFTWSEMSNQITDMAYYTLGALFIFIILGFMNKFKTHYPISKDELKNKEFVQAKKLIALSLLFGAFCLGIKDITLFAQNQLNSVSFNQFYTLLIFSDILIVLIALRYTMSYYKIFRYSAFVVATILIKITLSTPMHYNVILGVSAALFVLAISISFYYFMKDVEKTKN